MFSFRKPNTMNSAKAVIRRALLYVPGSSPKMLQKTMMLKVDCVAYDLEDSVTLSKKDEARANVCGFLRRSRLASVRETAVRINSVGSKLAEADLMELLKLPNLDTIVVPKVNSAPDLTFVTDILKYMQPHRNSHSPTLSVPNRPPIKLLALIESAKALSNLSSICTASPYLSGLIFAAEDFALDLSLTRTPSLNEFLYARSAIVTACRAHDLSSAIDLVCTSYKGEEGQKTLKEECLGGKSLGFNGKQCIHPSQIDMTQRSFAPSDEELTWAVRIAIAGKKADKQGRGAWTMDGKMIDAPVVGKAKSIIIRAEACGFDIKGISENWKFQEPG